MTHPTVLIASGCDRGTTTLYRCVHLQEQLAHIGISATVREWHNTDAIQAEEALDYDVLVLHRVAMTVTLERLIEQAHAQDKIVIFDTDDLVFEPTMTHWHRGVDRLSEEEKRLYHDGVRRYLATLQASDYVLTSTPLLAELARRRGKISFVHRNALGWEMQSLADRLYEERLSRSPTDRLIIGYSSGTPTHDADFQEAVPALLGVMARHPRVELRLLGPLLVPSELSVFGDRVRLFSFMDWRAWLEMVSHFDVNLAPLETGNLFCRAKSEVKFIEAAALGVPTVASRIDPFEYAITPGQDGLLAGNTAEWIEALKDLVTQPARRHEMGQAARRTIEKRYTVAARGADLASTLDKILTGRHPELALGEPASEEGPSAPLVINWVIFDPFKGSGGFTTIFRIVKYLVEFGHECHVYVNPVRTMRDYSEAQMKEFADRHFFPTGASFHRWEGEVQDADATIATIWPTVYDVINLPNAGRRYYFVQDFEPYFYPVGTEYVRAENTYRMGLHCITIGPWLAKLMREQYGAQADHFDFAVDTRIYWPRPVEKPPHPRIAFYARPSTPRRAYSVGIEALRLVKERRPDVEIVLYGDDHLDAPPSFPHTNKGILNQYELATLYSTCDAGLVLSLTNPSLVPFEMMACRCAVVDIESERVEELLIHEENALLTDPTPNAIADAVLRLLEDKELHQHIVEQAYRQASNLSWRESARQVEAVLLRHAPPPSRRTRVRRERESADVLLWQIHHLLDEQASQEETLARSEKMLHQVLVEKARLADQLRKTEAVVYRRHSRRWLNRLRANARHWGQKIIRRDTRAWLGDKLLIKIKTTNQPLRQSFFVDRSHLCRIDILFANHNPLNTRPVLFRLWEGDERGRLLVSQSIPASHICPDQPHSIEFEPQLDSFERTYTFTLTVPGATACDGYAFWRFSRPLHREASLRCGAHHLQGQLAFQCYYQVQGETIPASEAPQAWGSALDHEPEIPTRFKRAVGGEFREVRRLLGRVKAITQGRGIDGLLAEAVSYVQWRWLRLIGEA